MEQSLYELPEGWEWKPLEDVARLGAERGFVPDAQEGKVPFVGMSDIDQDSGLGSTFELRDFEKVRKGYTKFQKNAVLVAKITPCTENNKTALIDNLDGGFATTEVYPVHPLSLTDPHYLLQFFRSPSVRDLLVSKMEGATGRQRVPTSALASLLVPLPRLDEQKRIVAKLDALFTRIDAAITHLQETLALSKALFASALDGALVPGGDRNKLPTGWEWTELGEVCTLENGDRGKNYPSRSAFVETGIPVINAGNLTGEGVDSAGLNYITRERFDLISNGKVREGDILFCLRGTLGKVGLVKGIDEGVIASSLVIVRVDDGLDNGFLLAYLNSYFCSEMIDKYDNGAAQPNLSAKNLKKFQIPLPPMEDQRRIVAYLDTLAEHTRTLEAEAQKRLDQLATLKSSLLDSAFRGQL